MGHRWRALIDADRNQPQIDRHLLARVYTYARPHLREVAIVLVTIVIISLLELIPPLLYRELIDEVLPNRDWLRLNLLAGAMLGIPLVTAGIGLVQRHYSARAGEGIIYDLRGAMYHHLQRMSMRFFTHTKAGEIISRFNNDVVGAQNAITGTIPSIVTNVVTIASTLVVMATIEWRLALMAVLVVPVFLLPARYFAGAMRVLRRQSMQQNAEMSTLVNETLTVNGALLVKTFGNQRREAARFDQSNIAVRQLGIRRAELGQLFFLGMRIVGAVGTALIYWLGGYLVLNNAITTGTIVAFAAYLVRLYGPIAALSNVHIEFAQSMVSFERVFEYLDKPVEIEDKPGAVVLQNVKGHIVFDRVWFKYQGALPGTAPQPARNDAPDHDPGAEDTLLDSTVPIPSRQWALEDVSFTIEPGQLVALVGPSGAGKTTITYLLPRLYDPTQGSIRIDGIDLRDATLESLAHEIGIVTQESYLFHDTIRANLRYAKADATDEELETACRAANIHDMILGLPSGYDTVVGERGYRLSGGEKQRLAIARVILKNPRILVLDEATSHLDSQNEALIQAALEPLFHGRTSVVIAHRLSTVLAAHKILVLNQGKVVEQGTHAELLARDGLYAHLYRTQFRHTAPPAAEPAAAPAPLSLAPAD